MRWLVTGGNTQTPIDRVRCLTNIFSGRTGSRIALAAAERGHDVVLLTSHPNTVAEAAPEPAVAARVEIVPYRTFDDLANLLERHVSGGAYDAIVHCAAVSDYLAGGTFAPDAGTRFDPEAGTWQADDGAPRLVDVAAGKVSSRHDELWLRLTPAPKLVDRIRDPWGFRGKLVKFKLEVGLSDAELLARGAAARTQSGADWLVANTLEGMHDVAWLIGPDGSTTRLDRSELASRLVAALSDDGA